MPNPRIITDAEQIAVIEQAVAEGWSISSVDIGPNSDGVVTFSKIVRRPDHPSHVFAGFETVTQEWGCGLSACRHAKDMMQRAV